ncbi:C4-dicarboxylate transport system permease small protein [Sporosarcina newyorkensis 2681]|uniref:C4-dicarboxylate transport system permease small protein n=1 Tax=Sporosarcina newyorkensis 2681 TaxID=1027292 RepID=F9DRS2_9BACL|nr:TRAP transporter small permease [Sporosarcina newyorkensis]EGQ26475.1 C4-dicarboxylate transport system permease small protein [Sporosarcina newyorkensis 2681]
MVKVWFNRLDDFIATCALTGVLFVTIVSIFYRFILGRPFAWAEEVTLGLFIWAVFIGISSAMKRGGHIGIDYFVERMPKPLKIGAQIIRTLVIYYVLLYVLVYLGFQLTAQATHKLTPVLGIGYHFVDIAVPIGGLLAAYHFSRTIIASFRNEPLEKGSH